MWVMLLGPAFAVIVLSFTDWLFGAPTIQWIGFGNYIELCGDKVFWQSLRNTLAYVAFTVPVSVFLGLGIALMIVNRLATLPPERLAMLPPAARIYLRA
jgi:multiple sugar transport system permease protein